MSLCGCSPVNLLTRLDPSFPAECSVKRDSDWLDAPFKRTRPSAVTSSPDLPSFDAVTCALSAEIQAKARLEAFLTTSAERRQRAVDKFAVAREALNAAERRALCRFDDEVANLVKGLSVEIEAYHVKAYQLYAASGLGCSAASNSLPDEQPATHAVDVVVAVSALELITEQCWSVVSYQDEFPNNQATDVSKEQSLLEQMASKLSDMAVNLMSKVSEEKQRTWSKCYSERLRAGTKNVAPTPLKRVHVSTLPLAVWEGFDSDYAQASLDSGCGPGIAISPDGCFLAVSNKSEDPVTIYSLPSFNVVATIRHVDNGGPVMDIATSCVRFTQRNTLILCGKRPDNSSFYCIQEVTISGDVTRTLLEPFGEGTRPQALDVSESVIVVGTNRKDHQVIVLDASSGDVRAKFGVRGRKPGQLAGVAGIGITTDPQGVVIAENDNRRVSLFALNGDYLGSTNPGRIPHGMSDILVLDKHRYLACACFPAVLLVVELKSSSTVESFPVITDKSTPSCDHLGRHDGGESFMTDPFALAASHGFLFVLEQGYQRVQVYA